MQLLISRVYINRNPSKRFKNLKNGIIGKQAITYMYTQCVQNICSDNIWK